MSDSRRLRNQGGARHHPADSSECSGRTLAVDRRCAKTSFRRAAPVVRFPGVARWNVGATRAMVLVGESKGGCQLLSSPRSSRRRFLVFGLIINNICPLLDFCNFFFGGVTPWRAGGFGLRSVKKSLYPARQPPINHVATGIAFWNEHPGINLSEPARCPPFAARC